MRTSLTICHFMQISFDGCGNTGRNEHSNLKSPSLFTRIRNWLFYIGALFGLANLQWKALTHGLLDIKEGGHIAQP